MKGNHKPDSFVVLRRKAKAANHRDVEFRKSFEAEFERMMIERERLFDELDRFPRNAKIEAKRKRMDRHITRMKMTLREFDKIF
jgi:hypothetical protein